MRSVEGWGYEYWSSEKAAIEKQAKAEIEKKRQADEAAAAVEAEKASSEESKAWGVHSKSKRKRHQYDQS